ncbi:MAG: hypothetical protein IJN88_05530, partial [Clostridia bacterium]|nr:hypothetical protein [Clostridia bacterium]
MKNKTFKKSLSVIMAVLMLMSSWVFFPGMVIFEAEAAETVGVTTSFTLSPNGNRGIPADDPSWIRLALTGESSAAGTSVVLFRFSNEELQRLADKDEVNLQFYAYSCNNRLSHNNVGVTVNADIYYIAQNADFVNNQGTSANVTDTGNSVLGTDYTYENAQNSAKSYFGLSDANFVGSFEQPTINGQGDASLRTGDANYMYPVTDIVKEKAAAGEDLSFIVMLRQGYSCSGDRGWSDIYIDSDSIALSDGNIMLDQLKSMIEAYEGYFEDGTFYTNLQNNYKAYNDAKRYYDAVKYGGVEFYTATAQSYMSAIDTAIANTGDNPTYVDYLNANITSRDGSSVSAAYRKNVIWYPWDFSWDITSNSARPTIQDTYFYFTMPNTIVGITDDSETTFPLHSFFWTATGSRYVRYVIAGSGTISSGVVGSSDFSTMAPWKISDDSNRHTTSGLAPGTDGFGGWVFEKNYRTDVSLKNAESNSDNFSYGQKYVYQISSYAQINKSTIGVDALNTYKKVDQGFTFATANMANQSGGSYKSDYGNHYASSYLNYGGALHVVYMDTYKKNYQNWKTLIPAISYKDYNGFVYSDATNVTTHLDDASAIRLDLNLTEANRVGSIDSTVTVWATNVNRGANYLANAKNAGTTRVTPKYLDLIDAITASDSIYSAGNTKYTAESWNAFAAAYEAAQAHMASLDPSGSDEQYSSDATAIGNLATDLNNARNALTVRTYDITFDNLIDFRDWNTTSASNAVISAVTNGGFTLTSNEGVGEGTSSSPFFAVQPGKQYKIDMDFEGDGWDVYIFFCDANGNWIDFADGPTNRYSSNGSTGIDKDNAVFTAPNKSEVVKAQIRVDANGSNNSVTFSNIRVYEEGTVVDGVSYVEAKTYSHGDPLGAKLSVPTKEGYTFNGWWVDSINTNGVKDAGEQVTDGEGNVVTDLQNFGITQDWVLYSEWTINKYTVTWKNEDGTVLETDTDVEYGTTPTYDGATPTKAADAQYTYTFKGWSPTVSAVTGDVVYTATYDKTANKYTIKFVNEDGTELQSSEVATGEIPVYTGTTPTKASTAEYTYIFAGWSPEIAAVTGDATYTATYTATKNKYTVTWQNEDGTVLETDTDVEYGATPVYNGAQPTKTATAQYTYTFSGWSPTVDKVTGNATYTAQFKENLRSYTVTWKNEDGTVLETDENVPYGNTPRYDGETPAKEATEQYTYTFSGWTPTVSAVTGDVTYVAQFESALNKYTVIWQDYDGTVLETDTDVEYGATPTYDGETPVREATAQYTYTFKGWSPDVSEVTGAVTYTAVYTETVNEYTVTWKNEDGTVLETDENVPYGTMPEYNGTVPTKDADAQYTYTFNTWDTAVSEVKGDITYTATYNKTVNSYKIKFVDEDGTTVLYEQTIDYGATPVYAGNTPTKAADAQYTYEFDGWTPAIATVTGEATYKATYKSTLRQYTVTWVDGDGKTLGTDTLDYGATPAYTGETPTKTATAQYTYTFNNNWSPEIAEVTGNVTYTAQFDSTVNSYTVTWQNDDGSVIDTTTVEYGTVPTHSDATKAATAEYTYTFAGWSPEVVAVTGDATYKATYTATKNSYTVTWLNDDDSVIDTTTVEYGTVPTHADASKEATAEYTYTFAGWTPEVVAVTGDATYKATYTATKNSYTVTWANVDGNGKTETSTVEYGEMPVYSGTPSKEATDEYTYTFKGWDPEVAAVTGDVTYTAQFEEAKNSYTITFIDEDGTELQSSEVAYGETPVYDGETPTKAADAQYTYIFTGWTPKIAEVTGDATYTATYRSTVNEYTIKFVNEDGTELQSSKVAYGETPAYTGETPTKAADAQYTYTFAGWDPEIVAVTGDATYTATYSSTVNEYTIKFVNEDGTELQSSEVAYGETPVYDGETPTKAADAQYTYIFTGWT